MKYYMDKRACKGLALLLGIIIIALIWIYAWKERASCCMGVPFLEEKVELVEYTYVDFSNELKYKDEEVAIDIESSTIYISQDIQENTSYMDLVSDITLENEEYTLFFGWDEAFHNLREAVANGHAFQLYVVDSNGAYMQYNLVITTLPLIKLDGEVAYQDEEARDVLIGGVYVWTPNDPEIEGYTIKHSDLEWHMRGSTTARLPKKSWKLSLKTENGENKDLDFCGLGADDDWVLNAMALDDTKVRERLFMDLWNEIATQNDYSYQMTKGEYVEVVVNGQYSGVYLLQRRIDAKYLELGENTALVRGMRVKGTITSIYEGYEIIQSDMPEDEVFAVMNGPYAGENAYRIDMNNFVDTNIMLAFAVAPDNSSYNNIYWVIEKADDYRLSMVPWDTDMSFGVLSKSGVGFHINYEETINREVFRQETGFVISDEYNARMISRWYELRSGVLSNENIFSYLDSYNEELMSSGAFNRNTECWGLRYEGIDTLDILKSFITDRLVWLDSIYFAQ